MHHALLHKPCFILITNLLCALPIFPFLAGSSKFSILTSIYPLSLFCTCPNFPILSILFSDNNLNILSSPNKFLLLYYLHLQTIDQSRFVTCFINLFFHSFCNKSPLTILHPPTFHANCKDFIIKLQVLHHLDEGPKTVTVNVSICVHFRVLPSGSLS
ncbi:hypothetical protein XENOCAPTIV_003691 [Xenoophorus captivus]|uniref:Uncharacterized protein n=1 Tax=Xenoophorus captivus TaxID=1517983 RepID=A0ABV0S511_9TELE